MLTSFTFHNVSINSLLKTLIKSILQAFTFHNVSINSTIPAEIRLFSVK